MVNVTMHEPRLFITTKPFFTTQTLGVDDVIFTFAFNVTPAHEAILFAGTWLPSFRVFAIATNGAVKIVEGPAPRAFAPIMLKLNVCPLGN